MPQCAIVTCNNTHRRTKGGNVRYHRFPGDLNTRTQWLEVCGKTVANYSTARVCSHHFSQVCYERDVQHELLGLPSRCRLKKGAVPDTNLPIETEELLPGSAIDILLAVGLVPFQPAQKTSGGVPRDLQKMRIMDDITEGCMVQPSSPGHAELRPENGTTEENGPTTENHNDNSTEQTGTASNKEESETKDTSAVEENNIKTDLTESTNNKRKEEDEEEETTGKKLKTDIEENFLQRNKMLNDCIEVMDCEESEDDRLQMQSDQLLSEIRALNELAREKEMEWNSILHLKKFKEELLVRIERKKQISIINSDKPDVDEIQEESRIKTGQSIMRLNISKSPQTDRINKQALLKAYNSDMNGSLDLRQNVRSRPTLDVQAIIADYRQRHPENVPRRGKRIRNSYMGSTRNSNILNFSSTALGSGSQMKQNNLQDISNELNLILGAMDSVDTSKGALESNQRIQESASFKNMLLQLSRLSQNEKNELLQNAMKPPPPYPEVTVHPVTSAAPLKNSLLHGILTKTPSRGNNKKNFSPTLARLLTAPEQLGDNTDSATPSITNNSNHPSNISISEMLSSSKARNEITITPVENQFDAATKKVSNVEDDGTEDSDDRLVIDESKRDGRRETENSSEAGDEVPECQGCNQKTAQFVCAGCGNQWYCSRDCQVSAWDEHSEVCCG